MNSQGQRIRLLRIALGMSQEDFGNIFGISKQYVYGLEKDKNVLSNDKLVKLLVDYNVNINYLLSGIGNMFLHNSNLEIDDLNNVEDNNYMPVNMINFSNIKVDILNEVRRMLKSEGIIK